LLSVLELGALSGADANATGVDLGAACTATVGVGDAAASGKLLALAVSDIFGTGVVGGQGKSRGSNCPVKRGQYIYSCTASGQ
jgi:hypothetical protein